ncbi:MAG: class I SAM-dependent methyltransferase [Anaerolineales bacterium]|nr:class I SAM-dependent methyltransferase [Anaerolineales bacterium]
MNLTIDQRATEITRRRYQRLSGFYDVMEAMAERRFRPWRDRLWGQVNGASILEVGVGTGKNMHCYPSRVRVTAIDLTPGMLVHAEKRMQRLGIQSQVDLHLGDAQALGFPDSSFDTALATFVFCSVSEPVLGLREMKRVVKPGGKILLLEHMRSSNPALGRIMDWLNPLVVRMMGANINRQTVDNVRKAGLEIEQIEELGMSGIFKMIVARVSKDDLGL